MFSINVTVTKGVHVIEVIGRMDGDTSPGVGERLDEAIAAGHNQLVLDLGSVDYISSPGLREIVRVYKLVYQGGGDLRIANVSERVMTVFELAGLDTTLHIYTSRMDAINSFE
ncbi:MAG: STAS domain-containing protein [Anaerolineae bacterium]|nr:STAS domain-containing protein [Anaerolineae bacterium]